MPRLALHLFGSPRIELDDKPIDIRRRKAIALLAYLAVTGQRYSRDALATLLWPELDQGRARAGLRRALTVLRKALGEDFLDVDRETVGLNPNAEIWLDVDEFRDRLAESQTHSHPEDEVCPACLPLLGEAAALYRDDFLAGFTLPDSLGFDEWQFFETEGLRDRLTSVLGRLALWHGERREYEPAIAYARRWVALDPLHEPAHRCLVRLYALSGQQAAALRQYEVCRKLLAEELGVEPSEEIQEMHQLVLKGELLPDIQGPRQGTEADPISERYRFERLISSKGSFGDTWLATDTWLERPVAIKCPKATHDPVRRERFLTEARMLARLNHPNITQIHDVLFDEGKNCFYLVMEYVEGEDLLDIISGGMPLSLDVVLDIGRGILKALSYVHDQGIVHRDVKPDNVMIADDVKLTDFGLANLKSILQEGTDFVAGTIGYLAPEQIEGRTTDGRADLYGLGVTLFEMLSGGRLPFDCADKYEMLSAHLHEAPPPISQFAPDVPPVLEQVIMRLLAKDPDDRYPSADAVMEVLDAIQVGPRLSNLPVQLTPFVGREAVLTEIKDRLEDPDCRLLTLIGPGGCGKTRLALKAAAAQLDNYSHGVFFVSLAPLDSTEAIVPTVAEAVGFTFYEGTEPRQQLLDYLRRRSILLILDNFEHLLVGAELVTDILKAAPDVKILATSRTRLNVGGEHRFQITGMDFPELTPLASADAVQYSAVKLFLQGAHRAQPGFELTDENLKGVIDVCWLVEGMPLAIRLAAAWVEMLSPQEIAAEISQGIDLLETDLRDVPERQRSMRAVFDHSWNLLTMREREVFEGLSVFRGGFTREVARAVTGASLRELRTLVDKSLLQRMPTGRYEVHELLRQYAADKLKGSGDADAARDAHGVYYAGFLNQREEDLKGRRQLGALDEIEADFENVRIAWIWALEQKNYATTGQMLRSLGWFCSYRSRYQEYRELFQQAREQLAPAPADEPHPVWGRILLAEFYARQGEVDRAQIERGLAIVQDAGNPEATVVGLRVLGEIALNDGDYAEALPCFERSLAICHDLNDKFNVAGALYELAETYRLLGRPGEAIKFARQSLDLSREIGDNYWAARSLYNTGVIAFFTGNYFEAEGYMQEANTIYRELGYKTGIASSDAVLSGLVFLRGDFEEAKTLLEGALEIATDLGNEQLLQSWPFRCNNQVTLNRLQGQQADELLDEDEHRVEEEPVPIADIPAMIDRFEVRRRLGAGNIVTVYLAHDPDSGRDVAVRLVNPELLESKLVKFAAEIIAELVHPAIPEFYGYGETVDSAYTVVEFVDGQDLKAILQEHEGFLPEKDVIGWAIQICDALTYLHSLRPKPIIFRDMKPSSVMLDRNGKVYLTDLNIAEAYQAGREQVAIGTEGYAPPEQYLGYTDARSDIFALGATLHYLLTRRNPYEEVPFSFHDAPPRSLNPAVSEELEAVILKAVEHHPEDRYQTAEEMKTALLACL